MVLGAWWHCDYSQGSVVNCWKTANVLTSWGHAGVLGHKSSPNLSSFLWFARDAVPWTPREMGNMPGLCILYFMYVLQLSLYCKTFKKSSLNVIQGFKESLYCYAWASMYCSRTPRQGLCSQTIYGAWTHILWLNDSFFYHRAILPSFFPLFWDGLPVTRASDCRLLHAMTQRM